MKLCERLKSLRESRNISQAEMSELIGIGQMTISRYERGEREPSLDALSRLAKFFEVSIPYLIGEEPDELKDPKAQAVFKLLTHASEKEVNKLYQLAKMVIEEDERN